MMRKTGWGLAILAAFIIGATCAQSYARISRPYYAAITRVLSLWHPWSHLELAVAWDTKNHGATLGLTGEVRSHRADPSPAALVVSKVQVGEVIETPVVFWTLLLLWPAPSLRRKVAILLLGVPLFLILDAITTGSQLLYPFAQASALLAGEQDPLTPWERWSRFLEAGGRFGIEVAFALLAVALPCPRRTPNSSEAAVGIVT